MANQNFSLSGRKRQGKNGQPPWRSQEWSFPKRSALKWFCAAVCMNVRFSLECPVATCGYNLLDEFTSMTISRSTLKNLLLWPFMFLLQLSPLWVFTLMLVCFSACGFLYYSLNSDFFGLAAPPFAELAFSDNFSMVRDTKDQRSWKITYETSPFSTFRGVVRHVSDWRDEPIPFATHDILITSGDFSSASRVSTRVYNHAFYYRWSSDPAPSGHINLLHIVPQTPQIYQQLLQVRDWNLVTISGREIFRIDLFDAAGKPTYYWQDEGCNSILVTSVQIDEPGTPIP